MIAVTKPRHRSDRSLSFARATSLSVALCALLLTGCSVGGTQGNGEVAGRQAPGTIPGDVTTATIISLAERTRAAGDYNSAVSFYRRALVLDKTQVKAYVGLGETLLAAGNPNEAVEAFRDGLAWGPNDPALLRGFGLALVSVNQPLSAIEMLNKAIKAEPSARTYGALGVAQNLIGDPDAADQAFRQGLALAPDDLDLLNNFGLSQALRGDYDAAVDTLHRAATDPKASARHRLNLAMVLGLAGRTEEAGRVARIDLDERSVRSNLAYYATLRALSPQARAAAILRPGAPVASRPATTCDTPKCSNPALAENKPIAAPTTPVGAAPLPAPKLAKAPVIATPAEKKAPKAAKEAKPAQAAAQVQPAEPVVKADAAPQAQESTPVAVASDAKPSAAKDAEAPAAVEPAKAEPAKPEQAIVDHTMPPPAWENPKPLTPTEATVPAVKADDTKIAAAAPQDPAPVVSNAPASSATTDDAKPTVTVDDAKPAMADGASTPSQADDVKPMIAAIDASPSVSSDAPPATAPVPVQTPVVKASTPSTASVANKHAAWIQIASFRSEQNAHAAWQNMSSGNQDLLHSLLFSVRKVDLGADKGTYYVLRMGPFETVERARDLCSALKDRNIGCLVAR